MSAGSFEVSKYSPCVRIGNWFEDLCRQEHLVKELEEKRATNEIKVLQTRKLFDILYKEIKLSSAAEQGYFFGSVIQLMPLQINVCGENTRRSIPTISIVATKSTALEITPDCELTVATVPYPITRNSFRLVSTDGQLYQGEPLKYEQYFRIQCLGGTEPIYLFCGPMSAGLVPMIHTSFEPRYATQLNLPVGLVRKSDIGVGQMFPSAYANWCCRHINEELRFDAKGLPISVDDDVVITHQATRKNLATTSAKVGTVFGKEYLICANNFAGTFQGTGWQNEWKIFNGHNLKPRFT